MAGLDDDAVTVTLDESGAVITKVEDAAKKAAAEDPISDLKGQFETLKGQLGQQTQRLVGAERELENTRQELASSQLDTVQSGIQAAEAEATTAEKEYIAAAEAGDFAAQARAQRKISSAETRIHRLREAEEDLKDQTATKPSKREPPRPVRENPPAPQQQPSDDPIAAFTQGMSPKSAAWIRAHPDCVTDPKKNARMLAAHSLAIADDIAVDTPEYFQRIEAGLSPTAKKVDPEPKPVSLRPSAPVAPTGNASGGMNGGGTITLTRREVEAANDGSLVWNYNDPNGKFKKGDNIGTQEFARRKVMMQRQGHYDKTYTE